MFMIVVTSQKRDVYGCVFGENYARELISVVASGCPTSMKCFVNLVLTRLLCDVVNGVCRLILNCR